jgi:hypothetical protein
LALLKISLAQTLRKKNKKTRLLALLKISLAQTLKLMGVPVPAFLGTIYYSLHYY